MDKQIKFESAERKDAIDKIWPQIENLQNQITQIVKRDEEFKSQIQNYAYDSFSGDNFFPTSPEFPY